MARLHTEFPHGGGLASRTVTAARLRASYLLGAGSSIAVRAKCVNRNQGPKGKRGPEGETRAWKGSSHRPALSSPVPSPGRRLTAILERSSNLNTGSLP